MPVETTITLGLIVVLVVIGLFQLLISFLIYLRTPDSRQRLSEPV